MEKREADQDPSITRFIERVYKVLVARTSALATRLFKARVSEESLCIVVFESGRVREVQA